MQPAYARRFHPLRLVPFLWLAWTPLRGAEGDPKATLPANVGPFDPAPLMAKLAERITTDRYTFAVLGDTKHAAAFPKKMIPFIQETLKPDFVLTTGDMVQSGGGSVGPGCWEKLSLEAGAEMKQRPWWPAIGNHELAGDPLAKLSGKSADEKRTLAAQHAEMGTELFKAFYHLPNVYYSFPFRNAVFIALPWQYPKGEALAWLEKELQGAQNAGKLIFVFNHCPFFTVGEKKVEHLPGKPNEVTALFDKYGVLAVFSGHDHIYHRTIRNGVAYIISAGGGAKIYKLFRRQEALPEDVYYGHNPDPDAPAGEQYVLVNGSTKTEKKFAASESFACLIQVDGKRVTLKAMACSGETWDEWVLSTGK